MFRIPNHKAARLVAAVCVLSALCLSFFASCTDRPADNAGTLTISVSDATPKMLMYTPSDGGPSAMSHYGVTLKNAEGETLKSTETPMPLYGSSGSFTIAGLVSGTYTVDATGYIKTGETYTAIATGTTGSFQLNPSSATTKTITIDTWATGNASSVTVDIVMPTDVITGNTATGTLTYALNKVEDNSSVIAEKSIQLSSQTLTEGKYTLTIPETIAPGRYVLIAGFTASGDDYKYMGAQAMLVYPNLPVTGTLSLDSNLAFESGFTVEDGIGGAIEVSGDGTYASDTDTVSIVLSKALDTGCSIVWYVDGVELSEGDYSVSGTTYTFTGLATGKRNIVGIVWDSGKKASIGALCINVEVRKKPVIEEVVTEILTIYAESSATSAVFSTNKIQINTKQDAYKYDYFVTVETSNPDYAFDNFKAKDVSNIGIFADAPFAGYSDINSTDDGIPKFALYVGTDAETKDFVPNSLCLAFTNSDEPYPATITLRIVPKSVEEEATGEVLKATAESIEAVNPVPLTGGKLLNSVEDIDKYDYYCSIEDQNGIILNESKLNCLYPEYRAYSDAANKEEGYSSAKCLIYLCNNTTEPFTANYHTFSYGPYFVNGDVTFPINITLKIVPKN